MANAQLRTVFPYVFSLAMILVMDIPQDLLFISDHAGSSLFLGVLYGDVRIREARDECAGWNGRASRR